MKKITRFFYQLYSATAFIREQILITMFGYKSHCKHSPTCSRYTQEMIEKKGILKGVVLGARRVVTCW